jgi:hypothetical protein
MRCEVIHQFFLSEYRPRRDTGKVEQISLQKTWALAMSVEEACPHQAATWLEQLVSSGKDGWKSGKMVGGIYADDRIVSLVSQWSLWR